MGSVGDAYDNTPCESFFASLECELLDRRTFRTHAEARMAVFQSIEGWYNLRRWHSALGDQSERLTATDEQRSLRHSESLLACSPYFLSSLRT